MFLNKKLLISISCLFANLCSVITSDRIIGVTKLGTCRAKLDDGTIIDLSNF